MESITKMPKSFLVKRILSDDFGPKGIVKCENEVPEKKKEKLYYETSCIHYGEKEPDEKVKQMDYKYYFDQYQERYSDQLRLLNHYFLYLHKNDCKMNEFIHTHHDMKTEQPLQENPPKKHTKVYSCKVCSKSFDRSSSLSNHMLIHNNSKSFKCKKCDLCFLRKSDLSKHEVIHSGEKPYKCQTCGKRFSQSSNMLTHQRRHTGIRPFACKICGKSFYRKVDVRRHHLIHRN